MINFFKNLKIKYKITLLFFITTFCILILFSGFILLRSYFLIYNTIDKSLENISNFIITHIETEKRLPDGIEYFGSKYWIKIYDNNKKVIYKSNLAKKIKKIPEFFPFFSNKKKFSYDISLKGKEYLYLSPDKYGHVEFRVFVKKFSNGYIQICYPIEQTEESFQNLLAVVAWGIGIFIIIIVFIGYFFSKSILNPLNEIIKKSNYISEKNLNIRLPVKNKDEIGELSLTLNNLFSKLEEAFKHQKEFTQNVAHELKTPLAMIKISTENLLNSSKFNEEQEIEIKKIIKEIQRLQNLISKLLLLSKVDYMKGDSKILETFNQVNLKDIIENILQEFEDFFKSKKITLTKKITKENIFIKGDSELLEKLFFNLFLNAYNFTPENGFIELKLEKKINKNVFSIRNSGKGIPQEKIKYIFTRFYRLDNSRSRDTGGTGLGLAICKAIAELHNGEIKAISKENEFTEFVVEFAS